MKNALFRRFLLAWVDASACCVALLASLVLWNFSNDISFPFPVSAAWLPMLAMALLHAVVYFAGRVYTVVWSLADIGAVVHMVLLELVSVTLAFVLNRALRWGIPTPALMMAAAVTTVICLASRMIWQVIYSRRSSIGKRVGKDPVMVVGAGEAGSYVISRYLPRRGVQARSILLVDDDPDKQQQRVQGVLVRGTSADIPSLCEREGVEQIIIAIPSIDKKSLERLVQLCHRTKCRVRVLGSVSDLPQDLEVAHPYEHNAPMLRELNASDFLEREEVRLDMQSISGYVSGKTVLITGGGGSIGSELCRQVMRFAPLQLVIFDIYENNAYTLLTELRNRYGADAPVQVVIGSVRDSVRMREVFDQYRPQVVFHAAAHKHVPLMESSPGEAVKNNVFGTKNTLDAALEFRVERFVLLSTDKAVNPTNIMGATKRICEMLVQSYAKRSRMKCMAVRFGNVLGSHGSVIPLFEAQIRAGGPVTVTDPDITRYFMTIPEAAQLVLQAGGLAQNGAVYILDMGEPVRILDLAERLIRFFGYTPGREIEIRYTGLREGEKMYEELLMAGERSSLLPTRHEKISIAPPMEIDEAEFARSLQRLQFACRNNQLDIRPLMCEVVDTYCPMPAPRHASLAAVGKGAK